MGNDQSTPKGKRGQRVAGQPILQYEDSTRRSSISSGHYVSAQNLASLDAFATSDSNTAKKKKKKTRGKGKSKQKKGTIEDESPQVDMYERGSFDSGKELTDEYLGDTYAAVSSPSVPELIVDVLHADVSGDNGDSYSTPSPAVSRTDIRPEVTSSSNKDAGDLYPANTSVTFNYSTADVTSHYATVNDVTGVYTSTSETQNTRVLLDDSRRTPPSEETSMLKENENDETGRDSDPFFPLIFRRSIKDPGSKQYNEVVKELSSVLEKRSQNSRPQSMCENKTESAVDLQMAKKVDGRHSVSMENVNAVFSNKSLLNKLENHLMIKNRHNANFERSGTQYTDSNYYHSLHTAMNGNHSQSAVSAMNGNHSQAVVNGDTTNSHVNEDIYALPNKNRKLTHAADKPSEPRYNSSGQLHTVTASPFVPDDLTYSTVNYNHSQTNVHVNSNVKITVRDGPQDGTPNHSHHNQLDNTQYHNNYGTDSGGNFTLKNSVVNRTGGWDNDHNHSNSGQHYTYTQHNQSLNTPYNQSSNTPYNQSLNTQHNQSLNTPYNQSSNTQYNQSLNGNHDDNTGTVTKIKISGGDIQKNVEYSDADYTKSHALHEGVPNGDGGFIIRKTGHGSSNSGHNHPNATSIDKGVPISDSGFIIRKTGHGSSNTGHNRPDNISSDQGVSIGDSGFIIRKTGTGSSNSGNNHSNATSSDQGVPISDTGFVIRKTGHGSSNSGHNYPDNLPNDSHNQPNYNFTITNATRTTHFDSKTRSSTELSQRSLTYFEKNRANTSFNPNFSYDMSFANETSDDEFSRSSFHSDVSSSGLSSPRSHKIMVSSADNSSSETYFITTDGAPKPVHLMQGSHDTTSPRSTPVTMTTIMEAPGKEKIIGNIGGVSSTVSSSSWSSDFAQHEEHRKVAVVKSSRTHGRTADGGQHSTSRYDQVGSHSGSLTRSGFSSPLTGPANVYVVVPPHSTRVPDLIVDHHSAGSSTGQRSTNRNGDTKYGSPFHQEISEGTLPPAHGEGLHRGEEDKPATFVIDARNLKGEPSVQVDGPNAIAKCSIDPLPDGQYKVTYIPVEVGLFDVYVRWNGKEIPGSPFHPKVVDARKVKVVGGWHHYMDGQQRISLVVGEEKQIPFDTSEAGPGQMRAEVKSPSALMPVEVDDEHKGKSIVKFVPREEGTHYIHLYWSDHPLVNSPYQGFAVNGAADPSKVWLTGRGLKEAIVREEAEFVIDGSQAGPGEPDVELTGVRAEIQVFKTPLGGGKFRCTYIPVIPGAYLLNISWNGRQLRGAPYKVNVIGASYPNRVVVNGEGLKGGLLGSNLDFRIDTRRAGPGELTAYCMGPTKVAYCELSDHHDGTYRLVVQPQEAGKHVLQIKYGGEHVQGSPFPFKVSAQPDASKVRVSGPGVEHGILANFQSQFIVETRGAGAGQLTVRIRGPKGAFQVEMYRESQKDRTILCRYYPSVIGLYIINVRWSGVDVPGSPFHVNIMDTQQDLEQVLHESFSDRSHHIHPNNSFHNSSINSSSQLRYPIQQNSQHHNMSRSSGYYHYREEM